MFPDQGNTPSLAAIQRAAAWIDPVVLDTVIDEWVRSRASQPGST